MGLIIMKPFLFNKPLNSSLEKEMNSIFIDIDDSPYSYNGIIVPRVTHILSEMIHEDYLMNWANYIGRYKKQNHNDIRDQSAHIGTEVHSAIEKYTSLNYVETFESEENVSNRLKMKNAFYSFKQWWDIIRMNDFKIIFQEQPLVCRYYGGTLDMFIMINGLKYLVDFKTSNHFNYKYHLQTAAYRRVLYYEYGIDTDGIIILRLSKDQVYFEEQLLDLRNHSILEYINQCDRTFMSLVYSYYNRKIVEDKFKKL